jgi:hypothetical protein
MILLILIHQNLDKKQNILFINKLLNDLLLLSYLMSGFPHYLKNIKVEKIVGIYD